MTAHPRVAVIVLAAGRSSRMGGINKLLLPVDGRPMVARVADAALASRAAPVIVVTGHQAEAVTAVLEGAAVTLIHNPRHAEGLSTSLKAGIAALPPEADGALVCLGDMPWIGACVLDQLIAAFDPGAGRAACVPVVEGRRGNPVLWGRHFFAEIQALTGDIGARDLLHRHAGLVCAVAVGDRSVLADVDTPEALKADACRAIFTASAKSRGGA